MIKKQAIQLFEERKVRTVWDDQEEKWYFSIVDVCGVLTDSKDPTAYWRKLKQRLKAEGNETVTNCHQLKLRAADGKNYNVVFYSLEMIIAVGYRVRGVRGTQFSSGLCSIC